MLPRSLAELYSPRITNQALAIDAFDITVFNEEGVTQWDVRVAMFKKVSHVASRRFISPFHLPLSELLADAALLVVLQFPYITQAQYKKHTGKSFEQDAEDTYHSLGDNFDKKTKVKLSDFLIIGER